MAAERKRPGVWETRIDTLFWDLVRIAFVGVLVRYLAVEGYTELHRIRLQAHNCLQQCTLGSP